MVLKVYYTDAVLRDDYRFSTSGNFYAPPAGELDACVTYIQSLPRTDPPEVFGLHDNANISSAIRESNLLLTTLLLMQPRETGAPAGGLTREQVLGNMARDIELKFPAAFDIEQCQLKFPVVYEESMNTVLVQELIRFNKLTDRVRVALRDLQKALRGEIIMGADLEATANSMFNGLVPDTWAAVAYPSLKPLGPWINDLLARLKFFSNWITLGAPTVYWISGFFFTQSFLTGALQNYARRHRLAIDQISLDFQVMEHIKEPKEGDEPVAPPADGVYVYGLFLEGAAWDYDSHALGEAAPKQLFSPVPCIWLRPDLTASITAANATRNYYPCPVYKTSRRAGTLSTTGHSTNFVLWINLPATHAESHWVQRGVACLCGLDT
jgi:dynein heavy chain